MCLGQSILPSHCHSLSLSHTYIAQNRRQSHFSHMCRSYHRHLHSCHSPGRVLFTHNGMLYNIIYIPSYTYTQYTHFNNVIPFSKLICQCSYSCSSGEIAGGCCLTLGIACRDHLLFTRSPAITGDRLLFTRSLVIACCSRFTCLYKVGAMISVASMPRYSLVPADEEASSNSTFLRLIRCPY